MNTLLPRRWWAVIALSLASFMTYLDNNVVNVALPSIQRDLHMTISGLEWIVSSYIFVFAGLMLVGGRLADVYGRRIMVLAGVVVFTAASLAAGLANSESMLLTARVVQGIGAAACIPPTLAIIQALFPDEKEREGALGTWMAIGSLAMAIGPFLGGVISQHMHWGWIFLINVPIGVITFIVAFASIKETRDPVKHRLDIPGLVTSTVAMFAVTYALIEGHDKGWTSSEIVACYVVGAVMLLAFIAIELRSSDPMIDMSMFRSSVFSGGITTFMLWSFGTLGIYFFTALYLQNVLNFSPTMAGAAFLPMAVALVAFAPVGPMLAKWLGNGLVIALGMAIIVISMFLVTNVGEHGHFVDLLLPFIAYGIGSGLLITPLNSSLTGAMPPALAGAAGGVINASRELAGLLGVTILGAVLDEKSASSIRHGATPLHAFLDGYQLAIIVGAILVAVGVPISAIAMRHVRTSAGAVSSPETVAV